MIRISFFETTVELSESAATRSWLLRTMLDISGESDVALSPPFPPEPCEKALRGLETLDFPPCAGVMRCLDWLGALGDDVLDAAVRAVTSAEDKEWDFSSDADGWIPDGILARVDFLRVTLYPISRFGELSTHAQRLVIRSNAKTLSDMLCSVPMNALLRLMLVDDTGRAEVDRAEVLHRAACTMWIAPPVLVVHRVHRAGVLDREAYDALVTERLGRFSALDFAIMDTFTPLVRRVHPHLVDFGKAIEHRVEESVGEFVRWATIKRSPRISNPRFNVCRYGTFDASTGTARLTLDCREVYVFSPGGVVVTRAASTVDFSPESYLLVISRLPLQL